MMSPSENEACFEFLRDVGPFKHVTPSRVMQICKDLVVEDYEQGMDIPIVYDSACESLRVIETGTVKRYVTGQGGSMVPIDLLGPGEIFGFLDPLREDYRKIKLMAVEHTVCYAIRKEDIFSLLSHQPSLLSQFVGKTRSVYRDAVGKNGPDSRGLMGGDKLLFTTKVGEIVTKPPVTASRDITIRQAALIMAEHRISSIVLVDDSAVPVGIVTDRDLRDKVIARARNIEDPISSIMSVFLIKVEASEYCFEALLKMIRYNIHHLLLVDKGKCTGIVTNHDFMMIKGSSPISVAREIEIQTSINDLLPLTRKIGEIIALLIKEGASADNITRIISEINDRLLKKVLEITERKLGTPPCTYCWLIYGSEGRMEQTFKTDMDNALIYADPPEGQEASAREYFNNLSSQAIEALELIGFPRCTANYMASNPKWCQPYSEWARYFAEWISTPTSEAVLSSVILFDFRGVYGDLSLADRLRGFVAGYASRYDMFLKHLADMTSSVRPPLGFLQRNFIVDKDGEHKNTLNIKFRCVAPIVNIVRLYCLEKGIRSVNTFDRINELKQVHPAMAEFGDDLAEAFEFLMLLRVHHQFDQISRGMLPDNHIDPEQLGNLEKKTLKAACQLISRVQDVIERHYSPGISL